MLLNITHISTNDIRFLRVFELHFRLQFGVERSNRQMRAKKQTHTYSMVLSSGTMAS